MRGPLLVSSPSMVLLALMALLSSSPLVCCRAFTALTGGAAAAVSATRNGVTGAPFFGAARVSPATADLRREAEAGRVLTRLLSARAGAVGSKVVEVKTLEEAEEQIQAAAKDDKPVIFDFTATWCGPCKLVAPVYDALSNEFDGQAVFLKVDVDINEETAQKFEVAQMPTFVFVKNSEVVGRVLGGNPDKLREAIVKLL